MRTGPDGSASPVLALAMASHPVPSIAVTAFVTAVSAAAGNTGLRALLVAGAVGTGQLSIGWSNDLLDRRRDVLSGRTDKPLATGDTAVRAVAVACGVAVVACVPLSFALGTTAGLAHLVAVAGGWAYNLGLKRTLASAVPYATSFALFTALATLSLPAPAWPRPWGLAAGALLGVGAHFLNVVPDVHQDLAAGVRGLPQRLGARRSAVLGALLMGLACLLVVAGPGRPVPAWALAGLAAAGGTTTAAAVLGRRRTPGRAPFLLAVVTAAVAVALTLARGADLT